MSDEIKLDDCINLCKERQTDIGGYLDKGVIFPKYIKEWQKQFEIYVMIEKILTAIKEGRGL